MIRLIWAERKVMVTEISTLYFYGAQKSISECTPCQSLRQMGYRSRRLHLVPLLSAEKQISEHTVGTDSLKVILHSYRLKKDQAMLFPSLQLSSFSESLSMIASDCYSWLTGVETIVKVWWAGHNHSCKKLLQLYLLSAQISLVILLQPFSSTVQCQM